MRVYEDHHNIHDPPGVITVLYEFDTEAEMLMSGLLDDPRRTSCFKSSYKYYIGGHFKESGECCATNNGH